MNIMFAKFYIYTLESINFISVKNFIRANFLFYLSFLLIYFLRTMLTYYINLLDTNYFCYFKNFNLVAFIYKYSFVVYLNNSKFIFKNILSLFILTVDRYFHIII